MDDPKDRAILSCRRTLGSRLDRIERCLNTVGQTPASEHQAEGVHPRQKSREAMDIFRTGVGGLNPIP